MRRFSVIWALFICPVLMLAIPVSARMGGLTVSSTNPDPTVGVIPTYNDAYPNWQNAGLLSIGGIPTRSTQCGSTVNPSGLTPPTANDDADLINAAITACTAGQVVQLGSGVFQLDQSEYIALNKGVTLRGTGSCSGSGGAATTATSGTGTVATISFSGGATIPVGTPIVITGITPSGYNTAGTVLSSSAGQITFNNPTTGSQSVAGTITTSLCATIINSRNGAVADWALNQTTAGSLCGVTPAVATGCTAGSGMILASPSGNFNWGWAGCFLGTVPTGCGATLTSDAAAGNTTVHVSSTTNFSVGMFVLIDEDPVQVSTANPTGGANVQASSDWLSSSGSPITLREEGGDIPGAFAFAPQRVNAEIHKISSIGSGTLTFDDQLSIAFRSTGGHDARVYWPTVQGSTPNPFLQQAGVENMSITRPGNGGIDFIFCAYCWAKNVEVSGWISGAFNFNYTFRNQVEFSYSHDCYDCENNGAEYPIGMSNAATETYLVNNIVVRGGKGMVGRAASINVVAYNYVDDTMYMQAVIGDYWQDMAVNGSHYAGPHHWLFEGNFGDNCDNDETHGNTVYHTYFRNECTGVRTPFTDISNAFNENDNSATGGWLSGVSPPPGQPGPLRAAGPMAFNYWMAYVGNVLGKSGVTTSGNGWVYNSPTANKSIWRSGWTGAEWPGPDSNLNGAVSPNYIFRHGDYDFFNNSIVDWTTGFSHTLPNSFYITSQTAPSFFSAGSGYPWPWVTPTGGSPLATGPSGCGGTCSALPALARWQAGTPFVQP